MSIKERLERHSIPIPECGCVIWTRALSTDGYGQFWANGRLRNAHIVAYELAKGPVPDGLEIDHLCRVRCCINPDHLEAVSDRENVIRGRGPAVTRARNMLRHSNTCPHGHDDLVYYLRKDGRMQKQCKTCQAIRHQKRKHVTRKSIAMAANPC